MLGLALSSAASRAETVRIRNGSKVGHGYMFMDGDDRCRVATAAHVVQPEKGQDLTRREVVVIDRFGRELTGTRIVQPNPAIDVAFLEVLSGARAGGCTLSRLGLDDLSRRMNAVSDIVVDTTNASGEQIQIRGEVRAKVIDGAGGAIFAIALRGADDDVSQGLSGSPVRDQEVPLGLVTNENEGLAVAVRFDIVKRLFREKVLTARAAIPPTGAARPDVVLAKGSLASPGSLQAVLDAAPVTFAGVNKRIEIELWYATPRSVTGVSAMVDGRQAMTITVATVGEPSRTASWVPARVCTPGPSPTANVACGFAPRTVYGVRLTLALAQDGPVSLSAIGVSP